MIGAAVAAMAISASAVCSDPGAKDTCVVWDFTVNLKTLDIKKTNCKDACGDKSTIYYLDSATRKLTGFLWTCEDCESTDELNVVLWDAKKKVPVIPCPPVGDYGFARAQDATMTDFWVYGKKATKVAASFFVDEDFITMTFAGLNGSIKTACNDCYIKSLSGNAAGELAIITQGTVVDIAGVQGWCGDKEETTTCEDDDITAVYTTLCEVCCGFDGWCEDGTATLDTGDKVPAYGTWKMKYSANKSKNKDGGVWRYVPNYAL